MTDDGRELAEAERRCRRHADALDRAGQGGLMLDVLLAGYDRRGAELAETMDALTLRSQLHAEEQRLLLDAEDRLIKVTAERDRLRVTEKRALDAERWTAGAGAFEKSVGQREAVRYILHGEVPRD